MLDSRVCHKGTTAKGAQSPPRSAGKKCPYYGHFSPVHLNLEPRVDYSAVNVGPPVTNYGLTNEN